MAVDPLPPTAADDLVELRPRTPLQHALARWLAAVYPAAFPGASEAYAGLEHAFAQGGGTCKVWVVLAEGTWPQAWLMLRAGAPGRHEIEIVHVGGVGEGGRYVAATPAAGRLLERAVTWAEEQNAVLLTHWTTSEGLALHGHRIYDLPDALARIGGGDSPIWAFWVGHGFMLWGLLSDLYGPGRHGALLARQLRR